MAELFPEGYEEEIVTTEDITEQSETGYREGVYFDPEAQDFIRDGQYRVISATGIESWENWCRNCLLTEKGVYPCYGETFGISTREVFQAETRDKAQSILIREICESLANDPYGRTKYVSDITIEWIDSDALSLDVTVIGIDNASIDITTVIDVRTR